MVSLFSLTGFWDGSTASAVVLSSEAVRARQLIGFVVSAVFCEIESEKFGRGILLLRVFTS